MDGNKLKDMMVTDYGGEKWSKEVELNESMTISNASRDEYASKIFNLGGTE